MSILLTPVVCKNEAEVGEAAFDGVRRRPVVAINEKGKMVVCCRRTAAKNGWEVQGTLHQRPRGVRVEVAETGKMIAKKVVSKAKVEKIKKEIDTAFGDLL